MSLKLKLEEKEQLVRQLESELEYYYKLARPECPLSAAYWRLNPALEQA